jgi:hypothetical protein
VSDADQTWTETDWLALKKETSFLNARFTVAIAPVLTILVCWDATLCGR